jgi:eukaryotic-like serine/threonine-protein kinase
VDPYPAPPPPDRPASERPAALDRLRSLLADRYAIERELGAGGMATVYLARDLKHGRLVALKLLRPELSEAVGERFFQEIHMAAQLQHPHLLPLFDSGRVPAAANGEDGADAGSEHTRWLLYYVMPYVQGESLRARLDREKQLPVHEAVRLATQVAGALHYAHRQGVIHRDIKPENILLHDGSALVADFGIALAVTNAAGARMTSTGLFVGTPQYMSPEQAVGERTLDSRTDVYALGAVLYEMLTGEPPHLAPTFHAILARRVAEDPVPVSELRPAVPPHVEAAVHQALQRLPADRFDSAADFAAALAGPGTALPHARRPATAGPAARRPWRASTLRPLLAAGALVTAGVLLTLILLSWRGPSPGTMAPAAEGRVVRFILTPPPEVRIERLGPVSPAGSHIVFTGVTQTGEQALWLQPLDEITATRLPGTDGGLSPFWSPNSRFIAFTAPGNRLLRIDIRGGPPELIAADASAFGGGSWNRDDVIVFSTAIMGPLIRVPAAGGTPEPLTTLDAGSRQLVHQWPVFLPNGRDFLFAAREGEGEFVLYAASLDEPARHRRIGRVGSAFTFALPGYLLYLRGTSLMAQRFDVERLEVVGDAAAITDPVSLSDPHEPGTFWASADGVLVYQSRPLEGSELVWVDRAGRVLGSLGPPGTYRSFALSPDGRRAVVERFAAEPGHSDLWIIDAERDVPTRLTFDAWQESCLVWAPASRITFCSSRSGRWAIVQKDPVANAEETVLYESDDPRRGGSPQALAPDGRSLLFIDEPNAELKLLDLADGRARALPAPASVGLTADYSPDGRFIAYPSSESGISQIYVMPMDYPAGAWQVSRDGGVSVRWGQDGRELLYISPDGSMISAEIDTGPPFRVRGERVLFSSAGLQRCAHCAVSPYFVAAPDAERFLVRRDLERAAMPVTVVLNWTAALGH